MNKLFDVLGYLGPSICAFEDMDMVGVGRNVIAAGSSLLGDLLTNLDGMRHCEYPLVIMATTNKLDMMDEALCRPGRFDRKVNIGLPDEAHLRRIYSNLVNEEVDDSVMKLSSGFTGSHVNEVVNTAKILAASEGKTLVDCLGEACEIVRDNFFPEQGNMQVKAAIQARMIKKASKSRLGHKNLV